MPGRWRNDGRRLCDRCAFDRCGWRASNPQGLSPPRPKRGASASSATSARRICVAILCRRGAQGGPHVGAEARDLLGGVVAGREDEAVEAVLAREARELLHPVL